MSDTAIDPVPGSRGQTKSSWRSETSLRGVLNRLVHEQPEATLDEIRPLFVAKAEMVPTLVEEALNYALDNHWAQMHKPGRRPRLVPVPSAEQPKADASTTPAEQPEPRPSPKQIAAAQLAAASERLTQLVLLDWMMPNSKPLRACSGAEGRQFQKQIPAWLGKILAKVKDDEIIGEIVDESEVRKAAPKGWA